MSKIEVLKCDMCGKVFYNEEPSSIFKIHFVIEDKREHFPTLLSHLEDVCENCIVDIEVALNNVKTHFFADRDLLDMK
jgi:hypothetical protein